MIGYSIDGPLTVNTEVTPLILEFDSGAITVIDELRGTWGVYASISWSPRGDWLFFRGMDDASGVTRIFAHSVVEGTSYAVGASPEGTFFSMVAR